MVKTKSLQESVENYVSSVPIAMWRYKRYLMKEKNFSEDYAIDKAIEYGLKMLGAGVGESVPLEMAEAFYIEMSGICNALADSCHKIREQTTN